jgi:hypothetical protein
MTAIDSVSPSLLVLSHAVQQDPRAVQPLASHIPGRETTQADNTTAMPLIVSSIH